MSDHIHLCLSIPPKFSVSNTVGFIKGKSAIRTQLKQLVYLFVGRVTDLIGIRIGIVYANRLGIPTFHMPSEIFYLSPKRVHDKFMGNT